MEVMEAMLWAEDDVPIDSFLDGSASGRLRPGGNGGKRKRGRKRR